MDNIIVPVVVYGFALVFILGAIDILLSLSYIIGVIVQHCLGKVKGTHHE